MSQSEPTTITCPKCKHSQTFTLWHSVDVAADPGLKEKVLDRTLTTFSCENCGCKVGIEQDFLYRDSDRQLMILRQPDDADPEELDDDAFRLLRALSDDGYTYRLVTSMNELAEKILIWDDELDDRTVEVFKLVVWQALDEDQRGENGQLFYGGISGEDDAEAEMEFVLVNDSGTMSMFVPFEGEFRRLEQQIVEGLPDKATEQGKWLRVDRSYAEAVLGEDE